MGRNETMACGEASVIAITIGPTGNLVLLGLACLLAYLAVVFSISFRKQYLNWLRRSREDSGKCMNCGYDLRASRERCPECGAKIPESRAAPGPANWKAKLRNFSFLISTAFAEDSPSHRSQRMTTQAYIALGTNLGDREGNLRNALSQLAATPGVRLLRRSRVLDNPAVGGPPDSPPFLNAVAEIETTLSAEELLSRLLEIERDLGRTRSEKWGPRTIDLDLILFGGQVTKTDGLTVPHPRMHVRRFVLEPLAALAPNLVHPILGKTIEQLLHDINS